MRRYYRRLRFFLYFTLAIIVLDISAYVTIAALQLFRGNEHTLLEILFAITTPLVIFVWAILLTRTIELKSTFKTLLKENKYYLGVETTFYNYSLFETQITRINKRRKKISKYLLAFTACNQEITSNYIKNNIIIEYNGLIADMLSNYFNKNKLYKHFDSTYCFYRDCFLVYVIGEEDRVNSILRDLETNLYAIAKDNQIRLFVQPFFGITKYDESVDLNVNVSNAVISKLQGEKTFELATFYNEENKVTVETDDVNEIINALKNKEFVVFYQPKFNLAKRRFISSEALIRWDSPEHGLIPPVKFIAKAEAAGLIHDIDMYVFRKVCEDLNDAKRRGRRIIPVSINFSLYEFYSPSFVEDIIEIIDGNNIPHHLIEIEITETTSQSNPFLSISIMKKLKEKGLRVLMDDFGVGYSNFLNLKKMPIDCLKIDKSFIDEVVNDEKARSIVKFLIELGKINNLEVIAEGVDNKEQVEILKKAKLDTIQGYFYSKPLSKKEYESFLINNPFEKKEAN